VCREYFSIIFNVKKCALYPIKYGTMTATVTAKTVTASRTMTTTATNPTTTITKTETTVRGTKLKRS
jgi:hypothetical protein